MTLAPLVLIPQHFGSLVFERRTSRYLPFDGEATRALLRTRTERIDAIAAEARAPAAVFAFYEAFERRGFFSPDGRFAGEVLDPTPVPVDHLVGPLAVHLELTAACNLSCSHCFAGHLPRREPHLTLAELDDLFAELASLGSLRLGLTGGEPLLRPDLLEVLDAARARGLHACLTTNALLLDEPMARELGRRRDVWLNVSLEGPDPETNDPVRGPGTFAAVREKLRLLRRHARFTLAFTVTSRNHRQVTACAELAREVGASTAIFRPLYPVGVALEHPELMPDFSDYSSALEALSGEVAGGRGCGLDGFSPRTRDATRPRVVTGPGCGAGTTVASISVSGEVSPCSFLGPDMGAGNLRERTFGEVWRASAGFRRLRQLPSEPGRFQGGCRARARVLAGDLNAPDPWHTAHAAGLGRSPLANVYVEGAAARPLPVVEAPWTTA